MATKHNVITTTRYRAYLNQNLYLTEFKQREERADAKLQLVCTFRRQYKQGSIDSH